VPSLDWFIYAFVRKEVVLSAQIEGTQATLVDLLTFEADDSAPPNADLEEVCNYLEALAYARGQLSDPNGLRLSMRLLNETHQRLMRGVRGAEKLPGEVRRSQNWIGGTRPGNAVYVPRHQTCSTVGADAQTERADHDHGESRIPLHLAQAIAKVRPRMFDPRESPCLAHVF